MCYGSSEVQDGRQVPHDSDIYNAEIASPGMIQISEHGSALAARGPFEQYNGFVDKMWPCQ